jgi:FAD dependent oxidoreductase TIGR03364
MSKKNAIVIGAGIVGLATARALSLKGYKVTVIERNSYAVGASIRNFGMVWPIGQPKGKLLDRAMRSREIWLELLEKGKIWHNPTGSLHLFYHDDEMQVGEEFVSQNQNYRTCKILNPADTLKLTEAANPKGLKGALWSDTEVIVESRQAILDLPKILEAMFKIEFIFGKTVTKVKKERVTLSDGGKLHADLIVVCSGADFETLYHEEFLASGITKCKLQMLRTVPQPNQWSIGPSLCGGLTLAHYGAFEKLPSLPKLKQRFEQDWKEQMKWGVHVLVSQSPEFELTLGDSHEYGWNFDPFDKQFINQLVLDYLKTFSNFKTLEIAQTWNGIYAKLPGKTEFISNPEKGVYIVNGLSGAGMTLSFGLAEEFVNSL